MDKKRILFPLLSLILLGVIFAVVYQNNRQSQEEHVEQEAEEAPKKNIVIIDPNPSDLYESLEKNPEYNVWYVLPAWLVSSKNNHPYLKDKVQYVEVETLESYEQIAEAVKNLQELYNLKKIDYILTSDKKTLMEQVAKVRTALGIKHGLQANQADVFVNKFQLKETLTQANILQSWYAPATNTLPKGRTTFQLTPLNAIGNKPTFQIRNNNDLQQKLQLIRKCRLGKYMLVENVKGKIYEVEALVKNGKIIQCKSSLKINIGSSVPNKIERVAYIQVHDSELKKVVQNIVRGLQYKQGGISIEIIKDKENNLYTTKVMPLTRTLEKQRINLLLGQSVRPHRKKTIDVEMCYKIPTFKKKSPYSKFMISSPLMNNQTLGHKDYRITTKYDSYRTEIQPKDLFQSKDVIRICRTYTTNTKLKAIQRELKFLREKHDITLDERTVWVPNVVLGKYIQKPWHLNAFQNFLITYIPFLKKLVYTVDVSLLLQIGAIAVLLVGLVVGAFCITFYKP